MTHALSRSVPLLGMLAMACSESPTAVLLDVAGAPAFAKSSGALAALSGAMQADAQLIEIWKDSRTAFQASINEFVSAIALTNTRALADAGGCTVKNNGGDLKEFLVEVAARRTFGFGYDKTASTSENHSLGVSWVPVDVRIRVKLKGNIDGFPPLTVVISDLGGGTTRYSFSGGAVNVERVTGGVKNFDELFCENQDVVHVDVTR